MKKFTLILSALFMMLNLTVYSQGGVVISDNGGGTADPHAVLDLQSNSKGFFMPRLSFLEMYNMPTSTPSGLLVQNTSDDNRIYFRDGLGWKTFLLAGEMAINNLKDASSNAARTSYYIGYRAGENHLDDPIDNTVVGYFAGIGFGTGYRNTAIGAYAGPANGTTDLHNTTTIGYNAKAHENHQIVLGTNLEMVFIPGRLKLDKRDASGLENLYGELGDIAVYDRDSMLYYYNKHGEWNRLDHDIYHVGDLLFGGVICYLDESGKHGLIAAVTNSNPTGGVVWSGGAAEHQTNARAEGIYGGEMNTTLIVANEATHYFSVSAAQNCATYTYFTGNDHTLVYGDWYLPTTEELHQMYLHKDILNAAISGISAHQIIQGVYWSSTENDNGSAMFLDMATGDEDHNFKTVKHNARPVRRF